MFGTVRNVQTCPDCQEPGQVIKEKCPDCHGSGYVSQRKTIEVTVPAGINNGQSIRICEKEAEYSEQTRTEGDLLVVVSVDRIRNSRNGNTILYPRSRSPLPRQHLATIKIIR